MASDAKKWKEGTFGEQTDMSTGTSELTFTQEQLDGIARHRKLLSKAQRHSDLRSVVEQLKEECGLSVSAKGLYRWYHGVLGGAGQQLLALVRTKQREVMWYEEELQRCNNCTSTTTSGDVQQQQRVPHARLAPSPSALLTQTTSADGLTPLRSSFQDEREGQHGSRKRGRHAEKGEAAAEGEAEGALGTASDPLLILSQTPNRSSKDWTPAAVKGRAKATAAAVDDATPLIDLKARKKRQAAPPAVADNVVAAHVTIDDFEDDVEASATSTDEEFSSDVSETLCEFLKRKKRLKQMEKKKKRRDEHEVERRKEALEKERKEAEQRQLHRDRQERQQQQQQQTKGFLKSTADFPKDICCEKCNDDVGDMVRCVGCGMVAHECCGGAFCDADRDERFCLSCRADRGIDDDLLGSEDTTNPSSDEDDDESTSCGGMFVRDSDCSDVLDPDEEEEDEGSCWEVENYSSPSEADSAEALLLERAITGRAAKPTAARKKDGSTSKKGRKSKSDRKERKKEKKKKHRK